MVVPRSDCRRARASSPTPRPSASARHRLLEARRRLSGRCGERDERGRVAGVGRLRVQERQDPGDGRGLAGPRSACDHREAPQHGHRGRQGLQVVGVFAVHVDREERRQALRQPCVVDLGAERLGATAQVVRHGHLVEPEAVQVEVRPFEVKREVGAGQPAGRHGLEPRLGHGPGQRLDLHLVLGLAARRAPDRPQVNADVTEARGVGRQRRRQQRRVVRPAAERAETAGDVRVGRGEDPRRVEQGQAAGRPAGRRRVERVERVAFGVGRAHAPSPSSKRSLSLVTNSVGGAHDHTPHGCPSTGTCSTALMPRRNRYSTPPRWRAGS